MVTFLLVLALSIYFISNVWMRWSAAPIIIALNSMSTSIKELPFPGNYLVSAAHRKKVTFFHLIFFKAVTICNMNQAKKSAVKKIRYGSSEYSILSNYCWHTQEKDNSTIKTGKWREFHAFLLKV